MNKKELKAREFTIGKPLEEKLAPNIIRNQKYNVITFIPLVSDVHAYVKYTTLYRHLYLPGLI